MKKIFFLILILSQIAFAQNSPAKYEAEMVKNPNKGGKDTRQVNAVIIFEKDSIKIVSRRKNEVFKEFKYTDIKRVEHSFSKTPLFPKSRTLAILTVLAGSPVSFGQEERHWLTIVTETDFVVLKIENDNYRLLKNEFLVRKFDLVTVDENK